MKTLYAAYLTGGELKVCIDATEQIPSVPLFRAENGLMGNAIAETGPPDHAIVKLENVPDELADMFLKQGADEQVFKDGFQAAQAAEGFQPWCTNMAEEKIWETLYQTPGFTWERQIKNPMFDPGFDAKKAVEDDYRDWLNGKK